MRNGTLRALTSALMGLALLGSASAQEAPARDPNFGRGERVSGETFATRSPVIAAHGAAATAHPLATQTAIDVLRAGGSAIDVDITADGRRVRLLSGEAFFDVAHDAARPFTVEAGGAKVVVLGTAFDVALDPSATTVQLARGVVGISAADNAAVAEMAPGDMATVDHDTGEILRETVPAGEIGAWRNGLLFVNDVPVENVISRLQRYHSAWISLPDGTLARQRVTGLYDLRDPDRALRALVQPLGGKVRTVSDYVRVLSRF